MTNIEGNKLIAEFMGFPKPVVGSLWNYDSSLDNSTETRNLEIEDIDARGYVKFKQKMAFERYGLSYFDGRVFDSNVFYLHKPCNKYHTSWDWLMRAVEKIERVQTEVDGYFGVYISSNSCTIQGTKFRSDDKYCKAYFSDHYGETKIEATWRAVVQFITWLNNQKPIV